MNVDILNRLEIILKELSPLEKKGLDTSSLKIFIKNYKNFIKINESSVESLTDEEKFDLVKRFLEDKKVFPTIKDVIFFANDKLGLDFKDQKESRDITIARIISRMKNNPLLKDKLKLSVLSMRNEKMHNISSSKSKKEIISAETFDKWAEIIRKI
ncbi:hypothetical protein LJC12_06020 [Odoribacter sp. OttesenSCG-928-J03]|nr:hypothetical protein [Odoribacter sp. OttesenSCG-928-J03]